jgi:hypothetical protein
VLKNSKKIPQHQPQIASVLITKPCQHISMSCPKSQWNILVILMKKLIFNGWQWFFSVSVSLIHFTNETTSWILIRMWNEENFLSADGFLIEMTELQDSFACFAIVWRLLNVLRLVWKHLSLKKLVWMRLNFRNLVWMHLNLRTSVKRQLNLRKLVWRRLNVLRLVWRHLNLKKLM